MLVRISITFRTRGRIKVRFCLECKNKLNVRVKLLLGWKIGLGSGLALVIKLVLRFG